MGIERVALASDEEEGPRRRGLVARPLRDKEQYAGLPLHYLFDLIPVGGNR